jgi:hypothetical protein
MSSPLIPFARSYLGRQPVDDKEVAETVGLIKAVVNKIDGDQTLIRGLGRKSHDDKRRCLRGFAAAADLYNAGKKTGSRVDFN